MSEQKDDKLDELHNNDLLSMCKQVLYQSLEHDLFDWMAEEVGDFGD